MVRGEEARELMVLVCCGSPCDNVVAAGNLGFGTKREEKIAQAASVCQWIIASWLNRLALDFLATPTPHICVQYVHIYDDERARWRTG